MASMNLIAIFWLAVFAVLWILGWIRTIKTWIRVSKEYPLKQRFYKIGEFSQFWVLLHIGMLLALSIIYTYMHL